MFTRFFLFLIVTVGLLYAKNDTTCYSIQLKSFKLKQNSSYDFSTQNYPKECKLFSFSDIKTIRCGCYEKYSTAKSSLSKLKKRYKNSMIVKSYRYRFHNKKRKPKTVLSLASPKKEKFTEVKKHKDELVQESFLDYITYQGNVKITAQSYFKKPKNKHSQNLLLSTNFEAKYQKNNFSLQTKLHMQGDYYDTKSSAQKTNRSFIRFDELYGTYDFENDQIGFGKNIQFWGALELRNISDIFNPDELRNDPFYKDKLGVVSFNYTHYTQSGELGLYLKLYEQNREMAYTPYVYYFFPSQISLTPILHYPLLYNKNLQTKASPYRPSLYLKYSDTTQTYYPIDYTFIYENGYDSQRYYNTKLLENNRFITQENAYLVNKFINYSTLVVGPTLYKFEAVYANILDDESISDYIHIGAGIEYTLTQIYKEADLGILVEYYNYTTLQDGKKTDIDLFELFENDLFLALRYSLNQGDDASILSGTILDLQYDEQVYYIEYSSRFLEDFKINFDYRYIQPSTKANTAFHLMGKHERVSFEFGYYF
jgi:hypothetical protein